jgi:hypothetical protein
MHMYMQDHDQRRRESDIKYYIKPLDIKALKIVGIKYRKY